MGYYGNEKKNTQELIENNDVACVHSNKKKLPVGPLVGVVAYVKRWSLLWVLI